MRWKRTSIFAAAIAAGLVFSVSQASAAFFAFNTTPQWPQRVSAQRLARNRNRFGHLGRRHAH